MKKPFLIFFTFVSLLIGLYFLEYQSTIDVSQVDSEIPIGEITKEIQVEQTFLAKRNNLSAIQVFFATYNRSNTSNLEFFLFDESNKMYMNKSISAKEIIDNSFLNLEFPKIPNSKNKKFRLIIKSDGTAGNSVTIWSTHSPSYKDGELIINGDRAGGDLKFQTLNTTRRFEKLLILIGEFPVNPIITILLCLGFYASFFTVIYSVFFSNRNKEN
ncbi:hypothetical protein D3C74_111450 [compost metagenome]